MFLLLTDAKSGAKTLVNFKKVSLVYPWVVQDPKSPNNAAMDVTVIVWDAMKLAADPAASMWVTEPFPGIAAAIAPHVRVL